MNVTKIAKVLIPFEASTLSQVTRHFRIAMSNVLRMPCAFPMSLSGRVRTSTEELNDEHLLLFLLSTFITILLALRSLSLLPPDTAWATTTERRREGEVDVLLGVEADDKRWDVHDLLADATNNMY